MDLTDLRQRILGYFPGQTLQVPNHGIRRVLLQVFGMGGHGKSSLINSCLCAVRDREYQDLARSGPGHGEVTVARQEYELTPCLVMIDNRGLSKMNAAEELEISAQFRQLRSLGAVSWGEKNITDTIEQFKQQHGSRLKDLMVPVCVYSCYRGWNPADDIQIEKIISNIHQITGILPIVVISHSSSGDCQRIKAEFQKFGCSHFVALENYTQNNRVRNTETDRNILELLKMCIWEAETGIGRLANQDPSRRPIQMLTGHVDQELQRLRETKEKIQRVQRK